MKDRVRVNRIVIAAAGSGCGKTVISCGLIRALKKRGLSVSARKCGPDYIDPMFHRTALGVGSGNLDSYFSGQDMLKYLLASGCKDSDITVIEGVMGYYDGLNGTDLKASTYELASLTGSPVVLVVDASGAGVTLSAIISGILNYREDNNIKGIILNRVSERFYERLKKLIEKECQTDVLGYVPFMKEMAISSRHLGLLQPGETEGICENLDVLADSMERTVDIDSLLSIAESAEELCPKKPWELEKYFTQDAYARIMKKRPLIAVARDEAFTFCYEDNMRFIEEFGGRIVFFSPVRDKKLADGVNGIILYGGYPENHARALSENVYMREEIKRAFERGIPIIAECGGFMYLQEVIEDTDGNGFDMCGILKGTSSYKKRLVRFGYVEAVSGCSGLYGEADIRLKCHEFHHYDSTECGSDFTAIKPLSGESYSCMVHKDTLAAGFPHIYAYGNPQAYLNFLDKCCKQGT